MQMNQTSRLGIIGCGAITETFYLPAIVKYPEMLKKITLVDKNSMRLKEISSRFGISNTTTDYHDLVGKTDGVIIAVPNHFHFKISQNCLDGGAHVLCEKPLVETTAEAEKLIAYANKKGLRVAVNNTRRLYPSYRRIKTILSNGEIGNLISIEYYEGVVFNWPTVSGFYFGSKESPKGVLMDRGAHVLDLVCWWLGSKPELLLSKNDSFGGPEAAAQVEFKKDDCSGVVRLSWLSKFKNTYKIEGTEGFITGDISDWRSFQIQSRNSGKAKKIKLKTKINQYPDFADLILSNFIDMVENHAEPLIAAEDVLDSISLLEESYASAKRFDMPWYDSLEKSNEK